MEEELDLTLFRLLCEGWCLPTQWYHGGLILSCWLRKQVVGPWLHLCSIAIILISSRLCLSPCRRSGNMSPGFEPDWLIDCMYPILSPFGQYTSPHVVGMNHGVRSGTEYTRSCYCWWLYCNIAWRTGIIGNENASKLLKLSIVAQALLARWSVGETDWNYFGAVVFLGRRQPVWLLFFFSLNDTPYIPRVQ